MPGPEDVGREARSAKRAAALFGALALIATFGLAWLVSTLLPSNRANMEKTLVVAAQNIPAYTELSPALLRIASWPKDAVPQNGFASIDVLLKSKQISIVPIAVGEPILLSKLANEPGSVGLGLQIADHVRAFVVEVDVPIARAHLLYPGAYVDVVATLKDQRLGEVTTRIVLQNLEVFSAGQPQTEVIQSTGMQTEEQSDTTRRRVVTLLATPAEVETLAFISREGKIDLALRGVGDQNLVETEGVNMKELIGVSDVQETKKPKPVIRKKKPAEPIGPSILKVGETR